MTLFSKDYNFNLILLQLFFSKDYDFNLIWLWPYSCNFDFVKKEPVQEFFFKKESVQNNSLLKKNQFRKKN